MLVSLIAAVTLTQSSGVWRLKPSFDPRDPKEAWAMTVDSQVEGVAHHATFEFTRSTRSRSRSKTVVAYGWDKLAIDDQEGESIRGWDAVVGPRGQLLKMDDTTDLNYRRMLAPMVFVYPEKAIAIGDKWSVEVTPLDSGRKLNYSYEAKSRELVDGVNTVIVAAKLKEDGETAISGSGTWWLSKVGKVVKFEMKLHNWIIPMAGNDVTDVVLRGKAL